ncbi:Plexin-A4-like [Oopsacas minuta]|uniref:Plexin-A4-like n=1 Tax=Oopsacas minuta TaxID=111878 RepID=A0AAV7JYX2_9METZ|nr:Plexin-A4-like [Oopsacas minuta]
MQAVYARFILQQSLLSILCVVFRSACASADLSLRWITNNSTLCLIINSITPSLAQTGETTQLILSIQNLPQLQTTYTYECVFLSYRTSVDRITMFGVDISLTGPDIPGEVQAYCEVPIQFTISSEFQFIDFSLYSTELASNFSLQEDGFIFYDCSYHSRCETCTSSPAPCYWCLYDNICTHSNTICTNTAVQPSMNSSFCPSITETIELSVHSGDNTTDVLGLFTVNAPEPILGFQYSCIYLYSNGNAIRNANWISSMLIECDPPVVVFSEDIDLIQFHLLWGDSSGIYINEYPINGK